MPVDVDLTTSNVKHFEPIGLIEKPTVKSCEAVTPFTDDQQNLSHAKDPFEKITEKNEQPISKSFIDDKQNLPHAKDPFEIMPEKIEQPNFKSNSSSTYLDIEQDELSEVMNARKQSHATSNPSFRLNHNNPLMWIGHITQSVLEDVVMKVCEELVSVDNVLAANILDIELLR